MRPPHALSWNLTNDREVTMLYAAAGRVAEQVRLQTLEAPVPIEQPRRRRGRPTKYVAVDLAAIRERYRRYCFERGEFFSMAGLASYSQIPLRSWYRYFKTLPEVAAHKSAFATVCQNWEDV